MGLVGNAIPLIVTDELNQLSQLNPTDPIRAEISGVGKLNQKQFKQADFVNNTIKLVVKSDTPGISNVTIGKSSYQVSFIEKAQQIARFHIEHDGYYQKSVVETVKIVALDEDDNVAPAVNFTGVVNIKAESGSARIIPETLEAKDFINGVADIKVVVGNENPLVLRAQNGALVGVSESLYMESAIVFDDINRTHQNYQAIKYLKDHNIINGYPDGTFKPHKTVNRVEALKMLMLAFNVEASGGAYELNFQDTDNSAWYSSTLSTAVAKGIVKGYPDGTFKPANTVNRAEYLKILFKTNNMESDSEITKPYEDVDVSDWFAGYAFLANKMNILDVKNNLYPADGMTRADVAETIYRMKMIQENNLVTYSK